MGRNKAAEPDQIPVEAWQCLGDDGVRWLTYLFNKTYRSSKMPMEWRVTEMIPIYKNKGDAQTCGNYRGIKLLSHTMKLWERVIETRLQRVTDVSENQFGFMPGHSSIEAIHIIRNLMEKYRQMQKNLEMVFIDLEKAYDYVPRNLIWKTLRDRNDILHVSESKEEFNRRLEQWRVALECNGLQISRQKTEYLRCDFDKNNDEQDDGVNICIGDQIVHPQTSFTYLGSMLHKSERIDEDVSHRIKVGWVKWRAATGVLCDRKIPLKLKGKFFKVAIRPDMLYGSESVDALSVDSVRRRGRPTCRWEDRIKLDLKELFLTEDMTSDRNAWRARIRKDK
ncbi:uncharacterized protein [Rutidosis leptorrhynchoides]|uniref:uncharacterized protein n=1 Tax=Rutidosis leptorrhynchoides TaxID=125765 RepID=UPI003A990E5F